jgi:predicted small lipoprotein YifL
MSHAAASLLAIALVVLPGCGQMGPLYMPEEGPPPDTPAAVPAPDATQDPSPTIDVD